MKTKLAVALLAILLFFNCIAISEINKSLDYHQSRINSLQMNEIKLAKDISDLKTFYEESNNYTTMQIKLLRDNKTSKESVYLMIEDAVKLYMEVE